GHIVHITTSGWLNSKARSKRGSWHRYNSYRGCHFPGPQESPTVDTRAQSLFLGMRLSASCPPVEVAIEAKLHSLILAVTSARDRVISVYISGVKAIFRLANWSKASSSRSIALA